MPTFHPPVYSKTDPCTGEAKPCYSFAITYREEEKEEWMSPYIATSEKDISLEQVTQWVQDNRSQWDSFIQAFMTPMTRYFSKPYTLTQIHKMTKYHLLPVPPHEFPCDTAILPKTIRISGGFFWVDWEAQCMDPEPEPEPIQLEVVPEVTTSSMAPPDSSQIEEVNLEDLDVNEDATEDLENPKKLYHRQRVKEAQLRMKLAVYRAQYEAKLYFEKYGEEVSASESEWEENSEEESSDEEDL